MRILASILVAIGSTAAQMILDRMNFPTWVLWAVGVPSYLLAALIFAWPWLKKKWRAPADDLTMPDNRPNVQPHEYGKDPKGTPLSGLVVINDGSAKAYQVTMPRTEIGKAIFISTDPTLANSMAPNEKVFFPFSWEEAGKPGYSGEKVRLFMTLEKMDSIVVPVVYRDSDHRWYQTDVTLEQDPNGFLLIGKQRRIKQP